MGVSDKASQERRRAARRRSLLLGGGLMLAAASLGGCGIQTGVKSLFGSGNADFASPEARSAQGASIAILPFENLTTHQNAGTILADLMTTELYRLGALKAVSYTHLTLPTICSV